LDFLHFKQQSERSFRAFLLYYGISFSYDASMSNDSKVSPGGRAGAKWGRLVLLLFFLSGLSALIYQVIWLRSLATVFGSTVYATTTVLASFMGGLALGSYIFGRRADGSRHPLFLYGVLEIGIGVFALLFPLLMHVYDDFYAVLQQKTALSFYSLSVVRFFVCAIVLVIPTTMMGGTFPVISRFYIRKYSQLTENVSLLYGLNTIGAVSGVILSGFFLISRIGLFKTSLLAIAINFAVGIVAIIMQGRNTCKVEAGSSCKEAKKPIRIDKASSAALPSISRKPIMLAVFLSGLASLSYEVIWTRTLIFILDSFVYSFSIMLATFLSGIGLGSLVMSRIANRIKRGYSLLGWLFILIGFSSLATLPFFAELTLWKESYLRSLSEDVAFDTAAPWGKYVLFKFLISALIMAVPTLLMGAAFPLAIKLYSSTMNDIGKRIGLVYASNTVGAILGSILAGFVFISFFGLRNALLVTAGISALTGILLFLLNSERPGRYRLISAGLPAVLFGLAVSFCPKDVYKRIFQKAQKTYELVYYREDPTATVTVHKRGEKVIININGLNVAGTDFDFLTTQKIQAHLAMLLHPNPERVLQIGFGSGGTCHSVSQHKSVTDIDCVELCSGVIEAARYFIPSNHRVLENPKVHLTIEDARNYILATTNRYDLILSDSIHPTYAGNGTLYSQDYFKLCKEKLKKNGYVSFWMPMYLLSTRDYKTIIKTFQSVFPYVTIWYVNNAIEAYSIVIGRNEPITIDVAQLKRKLKDPQLAGDLAQIDVLDENDILSYFMMGPDKVRQFVQDGDINSDDYPIIELRAPKSMTRRRTWYQNLKALSEMRETPTRFLRNAWKTGEEAELLTTKIEQTFDAVGLLIQGHLVNIITFDFDSEYSFYAKAAEICPDNRAINRLKSAATSRVMILRGEELIKRGSHEEAMNYYENAIRVNPDPFNDSVGYAYYRKGFIYWKQGNIAQTKAELDKCLSVLPNHKQALVMSALLSIESRHYDAAEATIEKLSDLYRHDDDIDKLRERLKNQ
jgi:spermidine synthase